MNMKKNSAVWWLCCFCSLLLSTNASSKDATFICEMSGNATSYGPNPQDNSDEKITQLVLLKVGSYDEKFVSMWVEPINCPSDLFRCNYFASSVEEELVKKESTLSMQKQFERHISTWRQNATLNRYTLKLDVSTQREYLRAPLQGLIVKYSGACKPIDRKL
jgi:hypothetical protein